MARDPARDGLEDEWTSTTGADLPVGPFHGSFHAGFRGSLETFEPPERLSVMDDARVHVRSLSSIDRSAQLVVWGTGGLALVKLTAVAGSDGALVWLAGILAPLVTLSFTMRPVIRRELRRAAAFWMIGFAVHACAAMVWATTLAGLRSLHDLAIAVWVIAGLHVLAAVFATPMLLGGLVLGARSDHGSGDAMLGVGGAWLAGAQLVLLFALHGTSGAASAPSVLASVVGIGAGLAAVATYLSRAAARRR